MRVLDLESGPYNHGSLLARSCDGRIDPIPSSFDWCPDAKFPDLETLQLEENSGPEEIALWYWHHWEYVFQRYYSGAVPIYDTRQSRRRQLHAPQRQGDNSQCSESREGERQNRTLLSMALVVMGTDQSDFLLRRLT